VRTLSILRACVRWLRKEEEEEVEEKGNKKRHAKIYAPRRRHNILFGFFCFVFGFVFAIF